MRPADGERRRQATFTFYRGPSLRSRRPAVEVRFPARGDCRALAELRQRLPSGLGLDLEAGPESLPFGGAVALVAAALLPGYELATGHGCEGDDGWVWASCDRLDLAASSLRLACELLSRHGEIEEGLSREIRALAEQGRPSKSYVGRRMLLEEFRQRHIPLYQISTTPRVEQLGQGAAGRHFYGTASEGDTLTAVALSKNKAASRELVQALGYPHTRQAVVNELGEALRAVERIGYPCVVKPIDGGQGYGITVGVTGNFELERAFTAAKRRTHGGVVIERYVRGDDHRMGVMGGRLCWAYRRRATTVTGDGRCTIAELLARENAARDEVLVRAGYYEKLVADEAMVHFLAHQGYRLDSVLEQGKEIPLRSQANISQGGLIKDFSAVVHPDNIAMVEHIARAARITCCGLDFITTDITRSWREGDCAVIEINCTPAMSGIGDTCLRMYSGGEIRGQGRIPSALVAGNDVLARDLAEALGRRGLKGGLATARECWLGSEQLFASGAGDLHAGLNAVVLHTETEALVVGASTDEIERRGLPLDYVDLAIVATAVSTPLRALLDECAGAVVDMSATPVPVDTLVDDVLRHYPRSTVEPLVTVCAEPADGALQVTITVMRPACIPWQEFDLALASLVPARFPHRGDTTVVTRHHLPRLTWWLAVGVLREASLALPPEPTVQCDVTWPDCLVREFPYRLSVPVEQQAPAFSAALQWSAETINHLFDGIMFGGDYSGALATARQQLVARLATPGNPG